MKGFSSSNVSGRVVSQLSGCCCDWAVRSSPRKYYDWDAQLTRHESSDSCVPPILHGSYASSNYDLNTSLPALFNLHRAYKPHWRTDAHRETR